INLQGDAPLLPHWIIDDLLKAMLDDPSIDLATPMHLLTGSLLKRFIQNKSEGSLTGTTVVFDNNNNALYFSKGVIPHHRQADKIKSLYKHIGMYAYRTPTLKRLQKIPQSKLEKIESLEQLRALENQIPIKMVEVSLKNRSYWSVDHPDDISIVENIINSEGELV
ncbi:MAG: 3-deoxy-manno-octulosonate cytidylyltransferase, partial [Legionellales bacterium]|nr:3-deoxy-manno-octulosonate cytidylyltransferase [Legionellales bacterium]